MKKTKKLGKNEVISILDFIEGIVYVRKVPKHLRNKQAEDIASYFENKLHLNLDDCQYMVGNLQVDDNTDY